MRYGKKRLVKRNKPISLVDAEDQFLLDRLKRRSLIRFTYLCCSCSFLFQNPTYDEEDLLLLYSNKGKGTIDYYKNVEKPEKDLFSFTLTQEHLKERQKRYAELIVSSQAANILDYGGSSGTNLMHPLLEDKDRYVYNFGKDSKLEKGIIVIKSLDIKNHFDYILNTHVLEHEPDPKATLKKLRQLIAPDGHLYIEVPFEYTERILTRRPGAIWHINYFNRKTIIEIAEKAGWRCERFEIRPLPYGHLILNCIVAIMRPIKKDFKYNRRTLNIYLAYDMAVSLLYRIMYISFQGLIGNTL